MALQGPNSLKILEQLVDVDLHALKFFRFGFCKHGRHACDRITNRLYRRLGYEIWFDSKFTRRRVGQRSFKRASFGIKPAGMLAFDVARLEAGFILLDVDYISAEKAMIPSQRYSPFEIGLGWTVDLKKEILSVVGHYERKRIRLVTPNRRLGNQSQ